MPISYVTLKGKELDVRINVAYIMAFTYDDEANETIVWLVGARNAIHYPGDQRREINMAINAAK